MKHLFRIVTVVAAAIFLCVGRVDAAPRMNPPAEEPAPRQFAPLQLQENRADLERLARELEETEKRIVELITKHQRNREEILKSYEAVRRLAEKYVEGAKTPDGQARLQKEFDANLVEFDLGIKDLEERLQSTRALKAEVEEMKTALEDKWGRCVEAGVCR